MWFEVKTFSFLRAKVNDVIPSPTGYCSSWFKNILKPVASHTPNNLSVSFARQYQWSILSLTRLTVSLTWLNPIKTCQNDAVFKMAERFEQNWKNGRFSWNNMNLHFLSCLILLMEFMCLFCQSELKKLTLVSCWKIRIFVDLPSQCGFIKWKKAFGRLRTFVWRKESNF